MKFFYKKEKGFMAVEILVAVSIIALSVLASTTVAQKSLTVSRRAVSNAQATFLLEEGAELIRLYRDSLYQDYSETAPDLSSLSVGTDYYLYYNPDFYGWQILNENQNDIPNFTRKINFTDVFRNNNWDIDALNQTYKDLGKFATVTVIQEEAGQTISTKSITFYINRLLFE